jgi:hypothetical protein
MPKEGRRENHYRNRDKRSNKVRHRPPSLGAAASATIYSLIETAKRNNLEPYHYLCYLFDRLPYAQSRLEFKKLLPQNLTPEILTDHYSKMFRWV